MGIAPVHDQVGTIEGGAEKLVVALELQFIRHHARSVCQHAVGRGDDIAFETQARHGARRVYSEIVCTTLETGRALTVGSLASLRTSLSYAAMVCTGALGIIFTT